MEKQKEVRKKTAEPGTTPWVLWLDVGLLNPRVKPEEVSSWWFILWRTGRIEGREFYSKLMEGGKAR